MKTTRSLVIILLFLSSCTPDDAPLPGTYWGRFHIDVENAPPIQKFDSNILIQEPTATSIKINGQTVSKKGYRIKGRIGPTAALPSDTFIDAKWRKKGSSYEIHGKFIAPAQFSQITGTFEMSN